MEEDLNPLEWKPVNRRSIFSTRVFDIHEIISCSPENTESTFYTLHAGDWVIVIPVLADENGEDSFLMVTQWRHGAGSMSIEFPGGVIDPGENPETAAARELREETGFSAGKITHAASLSPNPAIMDNRCHVYFAENLVNTRKLDLDDDEFISAQTITVRKVIDLMGHGPYIHGLMSAALFLYIQKKGLPATKNAVDSPR